MDTQQAIILREITKGSTPICLVTLGYAKNLPQHRTNRKNIAELVHWEKY
jgi:nitroreductase